jgi:hypothetical protein
MEKILKKRTLCGIPVLNFHAAGIDAGSMLTAVSYTDASGNQCLFETDDFTGSLAPILNQ